VDIHIGECYPMHIVLIGRFSLYRHGARGWSELALSSPIALLATDVAAGITSRGSSWQRRAEF
jgi:hypothetical protein